jgi:hypothetical protein
MSFDLHKTLADDFGGAEKWGYRAVDTIVSVQRDPFRLVSHNPIRSGSAPRVSDVSFWRGDIIACALFLKGARARVVRLYSMI